ncbi:hypothetical protein ACIA8K_23325 [Catenuloplanes sp. NPDC051500]|uniref:hypothetical protein n=1 Tax=Catenuloplanes sp. NPDC051500 TaxID=3363959 RepID=UPI0037B997E0
MPLPHDLSGRRGQQSRAARRPGPRRSVAMATTPLTTRATASAGEGTASSAVWVAVGLVLCLLSGVRGPARNAVAESAEQDPAVVPAHA